MLKTGKHLKTHTITERKKYYILARLREYSLVKKEDVEIRK